MMSGRGGEQEEVWYGHVCSTKRRNMPRMSYIQIPRTSHMPSTHKLNAGPHPTQPTHVLPELIASGESFRCTQAPHPALPLAGKRRGNR